MTPPELLALRSSAAVRARSHAVLDHVLAGQSPHFTVNETALETVADYVSEVTRLAYPALDIPYHSCWRHFDAGGVARWPALRAKVEGAEPAEITRVMIDLAVVSVVLGTDAGETWRFHEDETGLTLTRSEGLAAASLAMFAAGGFSSDPDRPLRVDAVALIGLEATTLGRFFQVSEENPLRALEERTRQLNALGAVLAGRPELFGSATPRPAGLLDALAPTITIGRLRASVILETLLESLSPIWPSSLEVDSFTVGDAGRHPAITVPDSSRQIVVFHATAQWLTYSLLEPFEAAGLAVTDIDELTALPDYRNGGLLVDLGLITPRQPIDPEQTYPEQSELVVEWRALTVALMDRLAGPVGERLGLEAWQLPLVKMMQGGTWAAGRRIAADKRPPGGGSPISIEDDPRL